MTLDEVVRKNVLYCGIIRVQDPKRWNQAMIVVDEGYKYIKF